MKGKGRAGWVRPNGVLLAVENAEPKSDGGATYQVSGVANTGAVMDDFFYGKVVLDLEGVKLNRERIPLLYEHMEPIGSVVSVKKADDGLAFTAELYADGITDRGAGVARLAKAGYEWQTSVYAIPHVEERIENDESTAKVNGQTIPGPLTIFREWTLREITITALGRDEATRADIAASSDRDGARARVGEAVEVEVLTQEQSMDDEKHVPTPPTPAAPQVDPEEIRDEERERAAEIADAAAEALAETEAAEVVQVMASAIREGKPASAVFRELIRASRKLQASAVRGPRPPVSPDHDRETHGFEGSDTGGGNGPVDLALEDAKNPSEAARRQFSALPADVQDSFWGDPRYWIADAHARAAGAY